MCVCACMRVYELKLYKLIVHDLRVCDSNGSGNSTHRTTHRSSSTYSKKRGGNRVPCTTCTLYNLKSSHFKHKQSSPHFLLLIHSFQQQTTMTMMTHQWIVKCIKDNLILQLQLKRKKEKDNNKKIKSKTVDKE